MTLAGDKSLDLETPAFMTRFYSIVLLYLYIPLQANVGPGCEDFLPALAPSKENGPRVFRWVTTETRPSEKRKK